MKPTDPIEPKPPIQVTRAGCFYIRSADYTIQITSLPQRYDPKPPEEQGPAYPEGGIWPGSFWLRDFNYGRSLFLRHPLTLATLSKPVGALINRLRDIGEGWLKGYLIHAEDVEIALLLVFEWTPTLQTIQGWSYRQQVAAFRWAVAEHRYANDDPEVKRLPMPEFLNAYIDEAEGDEEDH